MCLKARASVSPQHSPAFLSATAKRCELKTAPPSIVPATDEQVGISRWMVGSKRQLHGQRDLSQSGKPHTGSPLPRTAVIRNVRTIVRPVIRRMRVIEGLGARHPRATPPGSEFGTKWTPPGRGKRVCSVAHRVTSGREPSTWLTAAGADELAKRNIEGPPGARLGPR